jgi:hypothetical protein
MGGSMQLFVFAILLFGIGSWGQRREHWNYRLFVFGFALPAGFFFGWSMIRLMFPYFNIVEQLAIVGGVSLTMAGLAAVVLHHTKLN